jgi:hypothetical protein
LSAGAQPRSSDAAFQGLGISRARTPLSVFFSGGRARARSSGPEPARYREKLYAPTQAIGDAAYFLGFDSIIAPNARWSCNNLILFTDQIAPYDLEVMESSEVDCMEWRRKLK